MKKLIALLLSACLTLSLAACGTSGNNSSSAPSGGGADVSSQANSSAQKGYTIKLGELTDQDIEDITWEKEERKLFDFTDAANLPKPDKIIYYTPGKTITFEKGTEEYEKVLSLNQARCSGDIGEIQMGMYEWTPFFHAESALKYQYSEHYSPIFNLTRNGTYMVPDLYWIVAPSGSGTVYGQLPEPTELLAYLESLK